MTARPVGRMPRNAFRLLMACTAFEAIVFMALCLRGTDRFAAFVVVPDTTEYARVGLTLAQTSALTPSYRTLGYPLWICLASLIGGRAHWMHVAIGAQLLLNIPFTWLCFRLIERVVPDARPRLRELATLFFFWAGLGLALHLATDFLASFLFGVFLYGMLFWRGRGAVLGAGACLALATLTRPVFMFVPLLLPIAAWLAGRFASKVPVYALILWMACSLAATGASITRQYADYAYLGPSPGLLVQNIGDTLYYALEQGRAPGDKLSFAPVFQARISERAGREYGTLSAAEQETVAKQLFLEAFRLHPLAIGGRLLQNLVKYLFVPIEEFIQGLTIAFGSARVYFSDLRPLLGLACLPIWLLALSPPLDSPRPLKMYYLFAMLFLTYAVGIAAITNDAGERMRFPVLAFILPTAVWNAGAAERAVRRWMAPPP